MHLTLSSATVRTFRLEDAPSLARHGDHVEVWRRMLDAFPRPFTVECARNIIAETLSAPIELAWAIEHQGEVIGRVSLTPLTDVERVGAEIGIWLGWEIRSKGVATEVTKAISRHALTTLGFLRVSAHTFAWNDEAARVLEKSGFRLEGRMRQAAVKEGRVCDVLLFGKVQSDLRASEADVSAAREVGPADRSVS